MLTGLAFIFLFGILIGAIFKRLRLSALIGMLITGIILGPHVLNLLDASILSIAGELRELALIIILTRAGLSLEVSELRRVGRPAALMCFVPACFEIAGTMLLAPRLLNISLIEAMILGAVIAAVSPAVVVPKMLNLMEKRIGTAKFIPQMIMAGASVDDVFVIVIFTAATGIAQGGTLSAASALQIPFSIVTGLLIGAVAGVALNEFFVRSRLRNSLKVITLLSVSFLLVALEHAAPFPFSGLIAVMASGTAIQKRNPALAATLALKYSKLWVGAEVLLFVLVGAAINIGYARAAGLATVALILGALVFRMAGVTASLVKTKLNVRERTFCLFAYMPKATVQAAIGSVPLALGLPCGEMVLTVAVLSILITAPVGAFLIDLTHKRLLTQDD